MELHSCTVLRWSAPPPEGNALLCIAIACSRLGLRLHATAQWRPMPPCVHVLLLLPRGVLSSASGAATELARIMHTSSEGVELHLRLLAVAAAAACCRWCCCCSRQQP